MRNLKRVLSLTLASVMLLGMMVIGAGAAVDYPDVDEQDNVEAIDVLSTVGIMEGYETGNFQPDKQVTRAEMAAIMSRLLNLNTYVTGTNPFNDVPSWAEGYVSACYARGIINGYGNGKFGTEDPVTAVQAGAMLMRALGYFQNPADEADGFEVSYIRQAGKIGLYDRVGTTKASDNMTRNQIAQLVLNTLQSGMVEPDDSTFSITTPDGFTVAQGATNYVYVVARDNAVGQAINKTKAVEGSSTSGLQGWVLDLGEQLYNGDLKLYDDRYDDFWRPSRHWEYKGEPIGTYVKEELLKVDSSMNQQYKGYTTGIDGKTLYDLLGNDVVNNADWTVNVAIDGVNIGGQTGGTNHNNVLSDKDKANSYFDRTFMARGYQDTIGQTGNGVLTQVFVNSADKIVDVVVINTYLAKASADYSEKKDNVTLKVYALDKDGTGTANEVFYKVPGACKGAKADVDDSRNIDITSDDFYIKDIKKDDMFLVTQANGVIETMQEPEVISASTLTAFSKNNYVEAEGNKYNYNTTVEFEMETLEYWTSINGAQQLKDTEYNIYLDPYGYLIGVQVVEAVKNYIFLTGIDQGTSNLMNKTASAAGVLTDGTFINFSMDMTDSKAWYVHGGNNYANTATETGKFSAGPLWNTWCTYTVDKNGVYTLTEVRHEKEMAADKAKLGQYHDNEAFDLKVVVASADKDSDGATINSKNVSLRGAKYDIENYTANAAGKFVYGNNETIYLVADLKKVLADTAKPAGNLRQPTTGIDGNGGWNESFKGSGLDADPVGIIGGVDSVTTGIKNVDMTVWNAQQIFNKINDGNKLLAYSGGTYALYNDKGYIIAAVVVGEDNGTSKTLVYSHKGDLAREEYSETNDQWTWERKVYKDGEEITLTEIGTKLSSNGLKDMFAHAWFEVAYKADGTVKEVKPAWYMARNSEVGGNYRGAASKPALTKTVYDGPAGNADIAGDFVDDIENLQYAINNNKKTVTLYEEVWGGNNGKGEAAPGKVNMPENNAPSLKANTLYVDTRAEKGFYVEDNVKTVLFQTTNGKGHTITGDDISDLEDILEDLNYYNGSYKFKISAVLVNGHATFVVINDWNTDGVSKNPSIVGSSGIDKYGDPDGKGRLREAEHTGGGNYTVEYYDPNGELEGSAGRAARKAMVINRIEGDSGVPVKDFNPLTNQIIYDDGNGSAFGGTVATVTVRRMVAIKVDGTINQFTPHGVAFNAKIDLANAVSADTYYLKSTKTDETKSNLDSSNNKGLKFDNGDKTSAYNLVATAAEAEDDIKLVTAYEISPSSVTVTKANGTAISGNGAAANMYQKGAILTIEGGALGTGGYATLTENLGSGAKNYTGEVQKKVANLAKAEYTTYKVTGTATLGEKVEYKVTVKDYSGVIKEEYSEADGSKYVAFTGLYNGAIYAADVANNVSPSGTNKAVYAGTSTSASYTVSGSDAKDGDIVLTRVVAVKSSDNTITATKNGNASGDPMMTLNSTQYYIAVGTTLYLEGDSAKAGNQEIKVDYTDKDGTSKSNESISGSHKSVASTSVADATWVVGSKNEQTLDFKCS